MLADRYTAREEAECVLVQLMLEECERWVDDALDTMVAEPTRKAASLCELKIFEARTALVVQPQVMAHMAKWSKERREVVENKYEVLSIATELAMGFMANAWKENKGEEAAEEAIPEAVEE